MPYRFLNHTADEGLEVSSETLAGLFSDALQGMTDVVTEVDRVETVIERTLDVEAGRLDLLLLEFLGEALYRFEAHLELFNGARVEVKEGDEGWSVSGVAHGESLDKARHPMKVMIKAVTYHRLEVEEAEGGWRARVIFDI